ncbi:MAG: GNAT family N-acetyltransferase [Salinarimonadaceae bacterium]|nr:MAG: GNAT family N-acetyltransferase [Salinarimonadaceae bacterium]
MTTFRRAERLDLDVIVRLLADDPLGAGREAPGEPLDPRYLAAFEAIDRDANQLLLVAEEAGEVVGCLQLTFIPGVTRAGMWRGQIEGVRIAASQRGRGLGRKLFLHAIERCRARGCGLVQLTTDASREDAHGFYEALGFIPSHVGMKLAL